jgi:predicted transposase YdaD
MWEGSMGKPYDDNLKKLVNAHPQAFVSWVVPEALFVRERPHDLKRTALEVDGLFDVMVREQKMLLHIEFQTYNDVSMPSRLLQYNVLARIEHKLPVLSCVIHLLKDGAISKSPLRWDIPTGDDVLLFHYHTIEMADFSPQDILKMEQIGLLPLLPLTKGGAQREIADRMFNELDKPQQKDLALIGFELASLVFKEADKDWLVRRFHTMHDRLQDTLIYQLILKEGMEKARQEGIEKQLLEQARQEGQLEAREKQLEALRQIVQAIVAERFPKLAHLAKKQTILVNDEARLQHLIIKLITSQDVQEAKLHIFEVDEVEAEL